MIEVKTKKFKEFPMKMRKFKSNKLWRDNLIEILEQQGSKISWHWLDDQEYDKQLRIKLLEEAEEVQRAQDRDELIAELADVFEVIDSLCVLHKIPVHEIIAIQQKKHAERGGFEGRKFIGVVEHPEGSWGEQYCLAEPKKYPEIV